VGLLLAEPPGSFLLLKKSVQYTEMLPCPRPRPPPTTDDRCGAAVVCHVHVHVVGTRPSLVTAGDGGQPRLPVTAAAPSQQQ